MWAAWDSTCTSLRFICPMEPRGLAPRYEIGPWRNNHVFGCALCHTCQKKLMDSFDIKTPGLRQDYYAPEPSSMPVYSSRRVELTESGRVIRTMLLFHTMPSSSTSITSSPYISSSPSCFAPRGSTTLFASQESVWDGVLKKRYVEEEDE